MWQALAELRVVMCSTTVTAPLRPRVTLAARS